MGAFLWVKTHMFVHYGRNLTISQINQKFIDIQMGNSTIIK